MTDRQPPRTRRELREMQRARMAQEASEPAPDADAPTAAAEDHPHGHHTAAGPVDAPAETENAHENPAHRGEAPSRWTRPRAPREENDAHPGTLFIPRVEQRPEPQADEPHVEDETLRQSEVFAELAADDDTDATRTRADEDPLAEDSAVRRSRRRERLQRQATQAGLPRSAASAASAGSASEPAEDLEHPAGPTLGELDSPSALPAAASAQPPTVRPAPTGPPAHNPWTSPSGPRATSTPPARVAEGASADGAPAEATPGATVPKPEQGEQAQTPLARPKAPQPRIGSAYGPVAQPSRTATGKQSIVPPPSSDEAPGAPHEPSAQQDEPPRRRSRQRGDTDTGRINRSESVQRALSAGRPTTMSSEELARLEEERQQAVREALGRTPSTLDQQGPSFADVLGLPEQAPGATQARAKSRRRAAQSRAKTRGTEHAEATVVDRQAQKRLENTGLIAPVTQEISVAMPTPRVADELLSDVTEEEAKPLDARQAHGLDPLEYKISGVQRTRAGLAVVICSVIVAIAAVVIAIKL